jgi:hypothetical protein
MVLERRRGSLSRIALCMVAAAALVVAQLSGGLGAAEASNEVDLGVPLTSVVTNGAAYGEGPDGRSQAYLVANGAPARFNAVDIATGERVFSAPLPGAHNVWGLTVAPNGDVYIGTQRNGTLYRYVPGSEEVECLCEAIDDPRETHIWRVAAADDGRIYGGTYPRGKVFGFDPESGTFTDYGQMIEGHQYVRSITTAGDKVFAGTGTPAGLAELDPETGEVTRIPLPEEHGDQNFVYDLDHAGGLLFARLDPGSVMLIYDIEQGAWVDEIEDVSGLDISPEGPGDQVYLRTWDGELHAYKLSQRELRETGQTWPRHRGMGWAELGGQAFRDYPGPTLVSADFRGNLTLWNPRSGASQVIPTDVQGEPHDIRSLASGPDGTVYVGGYLGAPGFAQLDPGTDRFTIREGVGQVEGMGFVDGQMLLGRYPNALIYNWDMSEPWDLGTNPTGAVQLGEGIDRPFAFEPVDGQMAIGSVPGYGELGGAVTLFDPATNEFTNHHDVVEDESPVALAYQDGLLYGGTSIWGGLGIEPTASEGKLFIWDVATETTEFITVPVPGQEAVSSLVFHDGLLWGIAGGHVFAFDTDSREVVHDVALFDVPLGSAHWTGRDLVVVDDQLFGSTAGRVFAFDTATLEATVLAEGGITHLAADGNGDLYFARGTNLFRLER